MKFDIKLGFNLPSKNLIEEISSIINNNIVNNYRLNEDEFKNKFFEQEEELLEAKQQYENNLDIYNKNSYDSLIKNNTIKEIELKLAKGEKNKFYILLLEDYLLAFILKNLNLKQQNMEIILSIKSFLQIILNNKFNYTENNINIENLSLQLNWIESYSMEIVSILNMFIFLNNFSKDINLNEKIKEKIDEINIEYDNFNISQNIKIINRVFYNIIGSLINLLISDLNKILAEIISQQSLNDLLNDLNNIYYSLLSNNNSLNLSCKEIHSLHETIKIISILSFNDSEEEIEKNKKLIIDFIQKKIINKEKLDLKNKIEGPKLKKENDNNNENIQEDDTEEEKYLKNNLNNFYTYFKEKNNINY